MTESELREEIIASLTAQGFHVQDGEVFLPTTAAKPEIRSLHRLAVEHRIRRAEPNLQRYEDRLLLRIANGHEVVPESISPRLVEVHPRTEDELLFRYISLHWSVPVSSGYGRRLRFLVQDEFNGKVIGVIGLCDPVFALSARDSWIGWNTGARKRNLRHVLDAFILGAVPPYSQLLCGKLVAMAAASNEVRQIFETKYQGRQSVISGDVHNGGIVLVTTQSAFGQSSLYNRISIGQRKLYQSVGFTQGSGEFHFSNGLYTAIREHTLRNCLPTAKQSKWGTGFRNRREVIKKCLKHLGLSTALMYHGVRREVYVVPLAKNAREYLSGEQTEPDLWCLPFSSIFEVFRQRWLLPRSERHPTYRDYLSSSYRLWL